MFYVKCIGSRMGPHIIILYTYMLMLNKTMILRGTMAQVGLHSCSVTDPSVVGELYLPRIGKKLLDFIFIDLFWV
jgi:hypothetical protein